MTLLLLCLTLTAPAPAEPIKIGVYGTFSGPVGQLVGIGGRNGVVMAAEEINAAGGVLGRPLQIVERDVGLDPAKAVQAVNELIVKEKVAAILGPTTGGIAEASTRPANELKVPLIVNTATSNRVNELFTEFPENYVFRISFSDNLHATMLVQRAFETRKFGSVALFVDDTPVGQASRRRIDLAMDRRGKKFVHVAVVSPSVKDHTPHVKAARAAGAQAIIVQLLAPEALATLRAIRASGWAPEIIASYSSLGARSDPAMAGVFAPVPYHQDFFRSPIAKSHKARYLKRFGISNLDAAPYAYDSMRLLALAIQQAGTTDGVKLKDALENLTARYEGVTGDYEKPWSPADHEAVKREAIIWTVIKDGLTAPIASSP